MRMFGRLHTFFQSVSECSIISDFGKFVSLFLCVPCFKASHFFFKLAYALNQRYLLFLGGEDLSLKVYDRRVSNGSVVHILQSLRHIEHGLEQANADKQFTRHCGSSNAGSGGPSA